MAHPSVINVVTADPGQVQVGATPLDYGDNVAIAVTAGDSVLLPAAKQNMVCTVVNGGNPSVAIFPRLGEQINSNSPNTRILMFNNNSAFSDANFGVQVNLYCVDDGKWIG